jgi:hypothetical protein
MANNVKAFQACSGTDSFNFICNTGCQIGNGASIEPPKQSSEVKAKHAVPVIPQAVFHDFPHISGLKKTMQQKDCLWKPREVISADDSIATQVYTPNTPQLIAQ